MFSMMNEPVTRKPSSGPAAVTVDSVAQYLKAPKGSFYHRFASRDALLGELWLSIVLAYQPGFVAANLDLDEIAAVRARLPSLEHDRIFTPPA